MTGSSWNKLISTFSDHHLLQTAEWAEVKKKFGWQAYYLVWQKNQEQLELITSRSDDLMIPNPAAAALVLERQAFPGLSVLYVPKGPLLQDWSNKILREKVLLDLRSFARNRGALQIKIDPDVSVGKGEPGLEDSSSDPLGQSFEKELSEAGWRFSTEQIQFRNTYLINLEPEEEQILNRMKSKTRYNIRLSDRKGIKVRLGDRSDLKGLYKMYADTAVRGGFTIRGEEYYQTLWQSFMGDNLALSDPRAQPIIAEVDDVPVAGAVLFCFGKRAWYLHGMSLPEHSEKMPTYQVQWEGIRWAKSQGCIIYDMWGAPDQFNEADSMWGVYRFKRGFGGEVYRTIGAWDYPVKPTLYRIYTNMIPLILKGMRSIGDRQTATVAAEE